VSARIVWSTVGADQVLAYCARVSNPAHQDNPDVSRLLRYCANHQHWSPFEMASACLEVTTTRDIARQILRHRSFSFQEFSQRYATAGELPTAPLRECRLQDHSNRQSSLDCEDDALSIAWAEAQEEVQYIALNRYRWALSKGIAKEQARALLPEGLTTSRLYVAGTLRSWITYLQVRLDSSTQREHQDVARAVLAELRAVAPVTIGAFFPETAA